MPHCLMELTFTTFFNPGAHVRPSLLLTSVPRHLPTSARVTVYCPWTLGLESSEATDPYSVSLAADGERTQV